MLATVLYGTPTELVPVRTVAPATAVVSTAEAKAHLRVDHNDDNTLIDALVQAATDRLDGYNGILGRALVTQTWRADFSGFALSWCYWDATRYYGNVVRLPLGPVQTISSIKYWDTDNADQTVAVTNYALITDATGPIVVLNQGYSWPSTYNRFDAVRVTFVAGYGAASAVPEAIKAAIKLHVEQLYQPLSDAERQQNQAAYDALIAQYRRPSL